MLHRQHAWNMRCMALVCGLVCLAVGTLTGCGSGSSSQAQSTPTPSVRSIPAAPTGFSTFKNKDFRLAYPIGWTKHDPANGTGVQYEGPKEQVFVVANLGKLPSTPAAFDAAFCSPSGFGGTPAGAPKTVKINGEEWVQQQCNDVKGGKSAVVEATVYKDEFYYIVYASPMASFQADRSHYFNTMEQSVLFI